MVRVTKKGSIDRRFKTSGSIIKIILGLGLLYLISQMNDGHWRAAGTFVDGCLKIVSYLVNLFS